WVKLTSCPKLHFSAPGKSCTPAPAQLPSRKASGTRSLWRSDGISIMRGSSWTWSGRSALALVQLLHGQPGEGEYADGDQDQQGRDQDDRGVREERGVRLRAGRGPSQRGRGPALRVRSPLPAGQLRSWLCSVTVCWRGSAAAVPSRDWTMRATTSPERTYACRTCSAPRGFTSS